MADPITEFIGQQLHSVSDIDAGMLPKRLKQKKTFKWWPYQHHKLTKSFNVDAHEDRLIAALDKKYKKDKSRQDEVIALLEVGYRKQEVAQLLGVTRKTISRDVKKIKERLRLWEPKIRND